LRRRESTRDRCRKCFLPFTLFSARRQSRNEHKGRKKKKKAYWAEGEEEGGRSSPVPGMSVPTLSSPQVPPKTEKKSYERGGGKRHLWGGPNTAWCEGPVDQKKKEKEGKKEEHCEGEPQRAGRVFLASALGGGEKVKRGGGGKQKVTPGPLRALPCFGSGFKKEKKRKKGVPRKGLRGSADLRLHSQKKKNLGGRGLLIMLSERRKDVGGSVVGRVGRRAHAEPWRILRRAPPFGEEGKRGRPTVSRPWLPVFTVVPDGPSLILFPG